MPEITEEVVQAAMAAVEEDTIQRCVKICANYANARRVPHDGKVAGAKGAAARELENVIRAMPRKSK